MSVFHQAEQKMASANYLHLKGKEMTDLFLFGLSGMDILGAVVFIGCMIFLYKYAEWAYGE